MIDRRTIYDSISKVLLFVIFLLWTTTITMATEPSGTIDNDTYKWIIGIMFGVIQVLIGYIYVSGINSVKSSIRLLFEEMRKLERDKLDKLEHEKMCALIKKAESER